MINDDEQFEAIVKEIRRIYRSGPKTAVPEMEKYLEDKFMHLSQETRVIFFDRLMNAFGVENPAPDEEIVSDTMTLQKIFSLIIGKELAQNEELSTADFLQKVSEPLNNIFDMLNDLVRVMNVTLTGSEGGDRSIRTLIGSQVAGDMPSESLEQYLSQIKNAFLAVHQSFQDAAGEKVNMILKEMNPDRIESETGKGLRIGPMKKAEAFEIYRKKYERILKWFESDRFSEDLVRAFEKNCRKRLESR